MYHVENKDQLRLEDYELPFEGNLRKDNRWVRLADIMPWEHIEQIYLSSMNPMQGRGAIPARMAFGAIYIKESEKTSDEGCVRTIQENPYMQYFLGLKEFHQEPLFDASMMVHFRKRFPVNEVAKINEYICTGKWPEEMRNVDRNQAEQDDDDTPRTPRGGGSGLKGHKNPNTSKKKLKNRGKLLMDATVAPADIKYPTDIDLLNQCREHLETAVDMVWEKAEHKSHKLPYSAKKARKSYLNIAKSKKWTAKKLRKAIGEQLRYTELAQLRLEELRGKVPEKDIVFPYWLRDRLLVIPKVYEQQKRMYTQNTHNCTDRIVSLQQSHVRPIYRGKRPEPTEFGQKLHLSVVDGYTYLEQTSWNNFNEGTDLKETVEAYYRRFGFYPKAVLADKIYQTRENRAFCKERQIRISGPALGRRKQGVTEAKAARQMYKDACERNTIEGRNGNLKRCYGLDLMKAKLDESAKTEAALVVLVMNVAYRLIRRFLCFLYSLFVFPVFQ